MLFSINSFPLWKRRKGRGNKGKKKRGREKKTNKGNKKGNRRNGKKELKKELAYKSHTHKQEEKIKG
jgi:hypothetical protein